MLDSRVDTLSIASVTEHNRSSTAAVRALPDGSPTPDSSQIFRRPVQPTYQQPVTSLLHSPSVVNRDNTLQCVDHDEAGQSSVAMRVSLHLQDPVELLPHVVNIDSE